VQGTGDEHAVHTDVFELLQVIRVAYAAPGDEIEVGILLANLDALRDRARALVQSDGRGIEDDHRGEIARVQFVMGKQSAIAVIEGDN